MIKSNAPGIPKAIPLVKPEVQITQQEASALFNRIAFHESIQASLKCGVAIADKEGRQIYVNPSFCALLGYTQEELTGKLPPYAYWPPEHLQSISEAFQETLDNKAPQEGFELVFLRKDLVPVPVQVIISPFYDVNGLAGWLATVKDITRRKQAELQQKEADEKLRASYQYARSLIEASLDPLVTIDAAGKITDVNAATERITGLSRDFLIGTDFSDYFIEVEKAKTGYQKVFENGFVIDYPLTIRQSGGKLADVLYNASLYRNEEGKILGVFAAARDITHLKQIENEILRLNDTLEQRIAERTLQLETTNQELSFHLNELEQFAYITNHDLQEPLHTLITLSKLVKEENAGTLNADCEKYLEFISHSATRMSELVKGLFDYSLIGKQCVKGKIDCNSLVESVLTDLAGSIKSRNALIRVENLPVITGYETELRLLFQNLISNAIKFQQPHTVPDVSISCKSDGKMWLFSVKDNGIGIEEKFKEKIFIIFQRLHNRNEFDGVGIGLSHCKKIVEIHFGKIWVESAVGTGSVFKFTIPHVLDPHTSGQ